MNLKVSLNQDLICISPAVSLCKHCGSKNNQNKNGFCCLGCKTVYNLLNSSGLGNYYTLRAKTAEAEFIKPIESVAHNYQYLDDPEFKKKYSNPSATKMDFYLEGIHCAACLWLIEKLPTLCSEVLTSNLDVGRSVVHITIKQGGFFAPVAKTLAELGYNPHAIEHDTQAHLLQVKENRSWLIRIGVAGACAGNVMLMSVPLYSGLTGKLGIAFQWLSLLLFLPIVFYCATPFYRAAWASLYSKTISIDQPIVLAIVLGTLASIAHLISGSDLVYFDSLAALVFLLLSSRYILRRIQQNTFHSSHMLHFLSPSLAKLIDLKTGATKEVNVSVLKRGDYIKVNPSEVLPADGIVRFGTSSINAALLTGESVPKSVCAGEIVFSGTVNEDGVIDIEVTELGANTRLGKILKQIESGSLKKAEISTFADKVARWFLLAVFLAALIVFLSSSSFSEGFSRALALIIVTCPCALALATPLAMSVALGRAAKSGILIKGADVLEKISQAKNIILDKTGTLTEGNFEVLGFYQNKQIDNLKEIIYALEAQSKHPFAKAITSFLKPQIKNTLPEIFNYKETIGLGVSGSILNQQFEIRPLRSAYHSAVAISCNQEQVCEIYLGDVIRKETIRSIKKVKRFKLNPFILSGDNKGAVENIAWQLKIPFSQTEACADPETKKLFIENHPQSIMVGDGANDALALSTAFVGIAVHGSMEVSLRAADVYLTNPGLTPVVHLLELARDTRNTIYRNFAFSLFYNFIGGIAAATGHVTPLFAAILMPLSAFTVFGSSMIGARK